MDEGLSIFDKQVAQAASNLEGLANVLSKVPPLLTEIAVGQDALLALRFRSMAATIKGIIVEDTRMPKCVRARELLRAVGALYWAEQAIEDSLRERYPQQCSQLVEASYWCERLTNTAETQPQLFNPTQD